MNCLMRLLFSRAGYECNPRALEAYISRPQTKRSCKD